jgi:hypothetical protein
MRLSTTRVLCLGCVVLGAFSLLSMPVHELRAAAPGFRPMPSMRQPTPRPTMPGTMGNSRVIGSPQLANTPFNNTPNMFRNSMTNMGFNGFASGLGAFRTGFTPSMPRSALRSGGFNNGFMNMNGVNSLFPNGFSNLNGMNTFSPSMNGFGNSKVGFNGGNGL